MRSLLLLPVILLLFSFVSATASTEGVARLKRDIHSQVQNYAKSIDPASVVVVHLVPESKKVNLPGTPFSLKTIHFSENMKDISFKKALIRVYSSDNTVMRSAKKIIIDIARSYELKPKIQFKQFKNIKEKNNKINQLAEDKSSGARIPASEEVANKEKASNDGTQFLRGVFQKHQELLLVLFSLFVFLVSLLISQMIVSIRGASSMKQSIDRGLSHVAAELQDSKEAVATASDLHHEQAGGVILQNDSVLQSLGVHSLRELLYDCYWSEYDGYAKYIWNRIPVGKKSEIIASDTCLQSYAFYLSDFEYEINKDLHSSSYYLKPLPLSAINNVDLSKIIHQAPSCYAKISPIRQKSLQLSLSQQLEIINGKITTEVDNGVFSGISSAPRTLKIVQGLEFSDELEEAELLQVERIPLDVMTKTLSLVWAMKIDSSALSDILRDVSAKELAQAWVGPELVLNHLRSCLGEKKAAVVEGYRAQVRPVRRSIAFLRIHKEVIAHLKRENFEMPEEVVDASVRTSA